MTRHTRLLPLIVIPLLGAAALAAPSATAPVRSGAQIFEAACASCHGMDGRGAARSTLGFETEPPDLTDCNFSTREPDKDWGAVVHHGGPARAFDKMMPAFGEALSEAEIQRALDHARSFCRERSSWPRGELNLPRPLVTSKAFVEDEAVISTAVATEGKGEVMSKLIYEQRIGARGQFEVILPFGFLETEEEGWTGGIGDIGLATKWVLWHSLRTGSILSLALELFLPTGREDRGLGKGVTVVEPFVAFGQILPYKGFLQLQAGAEVSTEPSTAAHEVFWRGVLGASFSEHGFGRMWSPMIEVLGAAELEEDEAAVSWDLVPQLQASVSTRHHLLVAAGVRIPVTDFDARSSQFMMYLLWDWFDGSLAEGW